ncbi:MAG TPA: MFS transporter [bacterium]|nr:MFS transporter [bacterium]
MNTASRGGAPGIVLGAGGFCVNISWQVVLPVLSLYLAHLGFSLAAIGLVVGVFSLTMGLVELQAGVITAAIGRRWALLGGCAANALCLALAAAGHARLLVAVALAAVGAARGVLVPPLHATVADSTPPEGRGRAFGVFWLCTSIASLAGPAIGGFVAARAGEAAPFVLGALFSLAAIPLIAWWRVPGRAASRASFAGFIAFVSAPPVARIGVAMLLCYGLAGIWTTFLPLYAARQGVSVEVIGSIFAIQGGMYALMQVPIGRLAAREHGGWLTLAAILGMAGTELAVPLLRGAPPLLAAGAVYGAAFGIMPVTFVMRITRHVTPEEYTAALSVYNAAIDLGLFAGPLLGAAVARFALAAPFLLALPLGLAAAAIGVRAPETRAAVAPASQ